MHRAPIRYRGNADIGGGIKSGVIVAELEGFDGGDNCSTRRGRGVPCYGDSAVRQSLRWVEVETPRMICTATTLSKIALLRGHLVDNFDFAGLVFTAAEDRFQGDTGSPGEFVTAGKVSRSVSCMETATAPISSRTPRTMRAYFELASSLERSAATNVGGDGAEAFAVFTAHSGLDSGVEGEAVGLMAMLEMASRLSISRSAHRGFVLCRGCCTLSWMRFIPITACWTASRPP